MAKLFDGKKLFASAIKPTGGQPLDDRSVVSLFSDLTNASTFVVNGTSAAYKGMLVAVVETEQVYMLVNENNITSEESWVSVGSGNGSLAVETYGEAIALATNDNIGQVIYVKTKSSYDADGEEGEGAAIEYDAAPYIVIGAGQLQKLAASTASGNIDGDVAELKTKVATLEGEMDAAEAAIATKVETEAYNAKVEELEGAIAAAKTYAEEKASAAQTAAEGTAKGYTDTEVAAAKTYAEEKASAAQTAAEGYADGLNTAMDTRVKVLEAIDHDAYVEADKTLKTELQTEIDKKVAIEEGKRLMTTEEGTKLTGIEEGAQVNLIEIVKVNGTALTIAEADKSVDVIVPTAPVQGVADDEKIIALNGDKLKTTLTIAYVAASTNENGEHVPAQLRLQGKEGDVISSINADAFVKDGMVESVALDGPQGSETGKKYMVITWNLASGKETMRLDVSDLFNPYTAGDGLNLEDGTFSIKLATDEQYLTVTTNGLATTQALWDKVDEKDNAVLATAKTYAEGQAATAISTAEAKATELANAAQSAAISTAEAKATELANAAQTAAEGYADGLNTAMNTRVEALEAIDHDHENMEVLNGITAEKVSNWDSAEQNAKDYADGKFVTKEGFNEFEAEYEEKLNGIAAGAEVNVIESIKVNGVDATIGDNKNAEVEIKSTNIKLGKDIVIDDEVVYNENTEVSEVLKAIQESVAVAVSGGLTGVVGSQAIEVSAVAANKQTISVKVSAEENNLLSVKDDGLFVAMYYDGDDAE